MTTIKNSVKRHVIAPDGDSFPPGTLAADLLPLPDLSEELRAHGVRVTPRKLHYRLTMRDFPSYVLGGTIFALRGDLPQIAEAVSVVRKTRKPIRDSAARAASAPVLAAE